MRVRRGLSIRSPSVPASCVDLFGSRSPFHTPALKSVWRLRGGSKWPAPLLITRTDDTENRGSSRCGFLFVSYRGPHPVSNERALLRTSALIAGPAIRAPDSTLRRQPGCSLPQPLFRAAVQLLHHGPPARA